MSKRFACRAEHPDYSESNYIWSSVWCVCCGELLTVDEYESNCQECSVCYTKCRSFNGTNEEIVRALGKALYGVVWGMARDSRNRALATNDPQRDERMEGWRIPGCTKPVKYHTFSEYFQDWLLQNTEP